MAAPRYLELEDGITTLVFRMKHKVKCHDMIRELRRSLGPLWHKTYEPLLLKGFWDFIHMISATMAVVNFTSHQACCDCHQAIRPLIPSDDFVLSEVAITVFRNGQELSLSTARRGSNNLRILDQGKCGKPGKD
eukprot:s159_g31.t1